MPPLVRRADDRDRTAWDAFVASRPEADLLQAWAWGECAAYTDESAMRILLEEDAGRIRGVAQALIRPAALGRTIAYVPHGPVWDRSAPDADRLFAWLIHGLRTLGRKEKAIVVKIDPRAEPADQTDVSAVAAAHGLRPGPDLQARTTRILDLLDGGEALEASWHADARRLMRRAAREGTEVTISRQPDVGEIEILRDLLTNVAAENPEMRVRSIDFLSRLATEFDASSGWFLGIARVEEMPIAVMAFPRVGDRAYYLYGALRRDERYKHHYGSHAVMAAMLKALAADGCHSVDMWGVVEPDDPDAKPEWRGFSDFKRTFGGTPLRHPGLFDLVISPLWHRLRALRERTRGQMLGG
jgi:lipid II:glycine glycyltransferase (peptidoglycan interpeptide bridge formation enzyme)